MKSRWIFIAVLLVACCLLTVANAADERYELTVMEEWEKMPARAVIASKASVEQALYNWVFTNEILWKGLTREDRRTILDRTMKLNGTGLVVKIRLPKVERLKNVEFAMIPLTNGQESIIAVVMNLRPKEKGGWDTVKLSNGFYRIFRLENSHLVVSLAEDPAKQIQILDEEIAKKPNDPELWMGKAWIYDLWDQQKAIEEYERIISKFPDYAGAYNNLAMVYTGYSNMNFINPDKAVQYAKKACELTKYEEDGHVDTLARAYYVQGNVEKAIELTQANIQKKDEIVYRALLELMECNLASKS